MAITHYPVLMHYQDVNPPDSAEVNVIATCRFCGTEHLFTGSLAHTSYFTSGNQWITKQLFAINASLKQPLGNPNSPEVVFLYAKKLLRLRFFSLLTLKFPLSDFGFWVIMDAKKRQPFFSCRLCGGAYLIVGGASLQKFDVYS